MTRPAIDLKEPAFSAFTRRAAITPVIGPWVRRFIQFRRYRKVHRCRIFFVCGHPKSGTHWVANIVNLHPECFCRGELHLQALARTILHMRGNNIYGPNTRMRRAIEKHFRRMVRECLVTLNRDRPRAMVLGDHSPRALMDLVRDPTVRYLHITRDGRDIAVSFTYHWLRVRHPQYVQDHLRDIYLAEREFLKNSPDKAGESARRLLGNPDWVRAIAGQWAARVRNDLATLANTENRVAERTLQIRYEKLHANPEAERRRIYEHLGVDPALAKPMSVESKTLPGFKSEDPKSLYRKGKAGDWRAYFGPVQRRAFDEAAGAELIRLGYEPDRSWVDRDDGATFASAREVVVRPATAGTPIA